MGTITINIPMSPPSLKEATVESDEFKYEMIIRYESGVEKENLAISIRIKVFHIYVFLLSNVRE